MGFEMDDIPVQGAAAGDARIDRRSLWRMGLRSLAETTGKTLLSYWQGQLEANPPPQPRVRDRLRPPGALVETAFVARCTSCRDCVTACRYDTLAPDEAGRPWLHDPAGHPCYMCVGYPCIAACKPGALTFRDRTLRRIGKARIATNTCLAYQGQECHACVDACRDVRAIAVNDGKPVMNDNRCIGCAICVGQCPAPGTITVHPLP